MNEYETSVADEPGKSYEVPWTYQMMRSKIFPHLVALFFTLFNLFLVIGAAVPTNNPNGTKRKIPNWALPATVLPMYVLGALFSLFIIAVSPSLHFRGSGGPDNFVNYNNRKWIVDYPRIGSGTIAWQSRSEVWTRLTSNAEAEKATELRQRFENPLQDSQASRPV
jgi:hypothetical protein